MLPATADVILQLPCHGRKVRIAANAIPPFGRYLSIKCPEAGCSRRFDWRPPAVKETAVATVERREPTLDLRTFSRQHGLTSCGVRAPVPFGAVELREFDLMCSRFNRPFTVTLVKREMGDLFRVCSLADAKAYRELLQRAGRRIEQRGHRLGAIDEYDFAGFQCPHCGAGQVTGSTSDFCECGNCKTLGCYGSVQPIANGGETYICPNSACNPRRLSTVIDHHGRISTIAANNLLGVPQ